MSYLSLKKIKNVFRANKKRSNYFSNEYCNIAIHVRRPNPHDTRIEGSDTSDRVFLHIINKLRTVYASKKPLLHLYSQGESKDFKIFEAQDVVLHLNDTVEDSFTSMVLADVLVTAASSLVILQVFCQKALFIIFHFWHVPLPHWISVNALKMPISVTFCWEII